MSIGVWRPGNSLAHRLDPRAKVTFVVLYILACFLAQSAPVLAVLAVACACILCASASGPRAAVSAIAPFAPLMLFVAVFDVLFASGGTELACVGPLSITTGGVVLAVKSVARFACVVVGTSTLMSTTSPTELTDAAALMLRPLERVGLRTSGMSVAMGLALRFTGVLAGELSIVREAQELRGADFTGGVVKRLRAHVPVVIALFASAMRRSATLALAMENRGFDPSRRRTCMRTYRLTRSDAATLATATVLVALAIADVLL